MTIVAAGFLLGVAASLHCVAMCGPLMSLVLGGRRGRAAVIYQGARVSSYAVLGLAAGAAGQLAILAGAGRVLSVTVGLALIRSAAVRAGWVRSSVRSSAVSRVDSGVGASADAIVGLSGRVTALIARAARALRATGHHASVPGIAAAGVLNGLLPCGPVYAALATSAALGGWRLSGAFMLAFGAGTLPALVFAGAIADRVARTAGARWRRVVPAALVIVGVLLTARGLLPSHHHEASSLAPAHADHPVHSAHSAHAARSDSASTSAQAAGHR
jgi:uncharacterized protein